MTSPFTKPNPTQDKYNDIHARGGTYGSDLRNEQDVRNLLKTEIKSPFVRAMKQVGDAIEGFVGDIASAIRGDGGAKYQAINVAVTERLGPINTAITETGARHKELADKVDSNIQEQETTLKGTRQTLNDLDSMVKALKKADEEQKAKVQSSIDTAKSATTQAAELRNELTRLSLGLDARIEQSKAAKDLRDKFDKLNNEFGSRVDSAVKNSAELKQVQEVAKSATAKSTEASAKADKTLDALLNPIEIGTSLVSVNPVTQVPYWAEPATENTKLTSPVEGAKVYTHPGTSRTYGGFVTVDSRLEYEAEFYLHLDKPGVRTVIELRGPDGLLAVERFETYEDSDLKATFASYLWWTGENAPAGWHRVHVKFRFNKRVDKVKLANIYWTHSGGNSGTASISGLKISPVIPTQASVDAAQNKAIEANSKATEAVRGIATNAAQTALANTRALQAQEKINQEAAKWKVETEDWKAKKDQFEKTTKDFLKTQAAVEQLQTKTDTAQNDALTALNKPELNGSLVPMVPNNGLYKKLGKYEWIPEYTTFGNASTGAGSPILQATGRENTAVKGSAVDAEPGGTYRVEFTAYAGSSGSSIYIELRNAKNLDHAVESSTGFTIQGDSSGKVYGVNGGYLVGDVRLKKGTHTYIGYITLKKDVEQVRLYTIYWNHPNGSSTGTQMLYSLKVYQPVPSQAEIDDLQFKALEQGAKFDEAQVKINRLVQEQLWNHQDTMEFLDIRSPKTYGYEVKSNIWTIKKNPYLPAGPLSISSRVNTSISPFVTVLVGTGDEPKTFMVVCKGKWIGDFEVRANWTNGAVDVWNKKVPTGNARVFMFTGGNSVIGIRNISVTVAPTCLNRVMKVTASKGGVGDPDTRSGDISLLREATDYYSFRPSAPVKCDREVYDMSIEGEMVKVPAGRVLAGKVIQIPRYGVEYTFTEVWDYDGGWDNPKGNDYDSHSPKTPMDLNSTD